MRWEIVRLGDIASFSNGINFDKSAYSHGVKLIGVSDFGNRFFPDTDNLQEVKKEVVRDDDLLKDGDIVFVRSNGNKELVGRCMLINCITQPLTFSGFVIRGRIHDTEKYDPVFFTYHFKNIAFRRAMSGTAVGANIQNLSQGRLSAYIAKIPDIDTQHRMAKYLSTYDTLIENNQKQIKLLEEAAQRLYKEWFIDLRFPGHETTAIVDGVPEGWSMKQIDEAYSIKYGKTLPTSKILSKAKYPVYGASKVIGFYNQKNCEDYTVLITSRGNAGVVFRTHHKESFITNNSFVVTPKHTQLHTLFVFHQMLSLNFKAITTGSCQPQLTNTSISTKAVLFPSIEVLDLFNKRTDSLFEQIEVLIRNNDLLTDARDRLLPKLMNGEIEV